MYNSTMTNTFPYGYGSYNIGGSTIPQQGGRQVMMVGGYNGASMIQMGPNESVLALDESGTMVWLVKTDGAGYKNEMMKNNPLMKNVMDEIQANGGNAQAAFYAYAQKMGIDPNEILNMMNGR